VGNFSSVNRSTRLRAVRPRFDSWQGLGIFLFAHPASYPMGARGSSPGGKAVGGVELTTQLHLVPKSKNAWSYTSTPHTPSWCGAQLKYRDNFTFLYSVRRTADKRQADNKSNFISCGFCSLTTVFIRHSESLYNIPLHGQLSQRYITMGH